MRLLRLFSSCLFWIAVFPASAASLTASSVRATGRERTCVLLYHKPPNVVTTHAENDVKGRRTVFDDINSMNGYAGPQNNAATSIEQVTGVSSKWHAIGRLDVKTTGLLLLTNDGGLVHHVTNKEASSNTENSGKPISKTYDALIMGYHHDENDTQGSTDNASFMGILHQMRTVGVDIGAKYGGQTLPVEHIAVLDHPTPTTTLVSLTIVEGKNRQVRRMFHALGSGVMKLKRTRIGELLTLRKAGNHDFDYNNEDEADACLLNEGEWRVLSDEEVETCLNWKPRTLIQERKSHPKINKKGIKN
jgi:pseudouridine synthase